MTNDVNPCKSIKIYAILNEWSPERSAAEAAACKFVTPAACSAPLFVQPLPALSYITDPDASDATKAGDSGSA